MGPLSVRSERTKPCPVCWGHGWVVSYTYGSKVHVAPANRAVGSAGLAPTRCHTCTGTGRVASSHNTHGEESDMLSIQAKNDVQLHVDGRLEPMSELMGGNYGYTCTVERELVYGFMVDGRYLPRENPAILGLGDTFDVGPTDVTHALNKNPKLETHADSGLQLVQAWLGQGPPPAPVADEPYTLLCPALFTGGWGAESATSWCERVYVQQPIHGRRSLADLSRDLVVATPDGEFLLRCCRPVGLPSTDGRATVSVRACGVVALSRK